MIQTEDSSLDSIVESTRRRSTFYVPLTDEPQATITTKKDTSDYSFNWSINDSLNSSPDLLASSEKENRLKRYGIVLNGSINIDDSIEIPMQTTQTTHQSIHQNHSTPIRLMKARSRSNILSSLPDKHVQPPSPVKEKSKTLPQNLTPANTFPPKSSFLLKSTPKITSSGSAASGGHGTNTHSLLNYSHSSENCVISPSNNGVFGSGTTPSPKKSLSFIRRTHSTKLSRSNSLLRSLTSHKCAELNNQFSQYNVVPLQQEHLERCFHSECFTDAVKRMFFKVPEDTNTTVAATSTSTTKDLVNTTAVDDDDDDSGAHSGKQKYDSLFLLFLIS